MVELLLWHKIALYILLLGAIFVLVKTSQLKTHGRTVIPLKYRIMLATFFPLIIALAFVLGTIILAIAFVAISILIIYSLFSKKKVRISINRRINK